MHGGYQIAPAGWTGEVVPWGGDYSPTYPELTSTTDVAEARKMRHWREPALPAGWTFRAAAEGGYEIQPRDGYSALYVTADGEDGFELRGAYVGAVVSGAKEAAWHSGASLRETRVVAGRPAVVIYSRASRGFPLTLWVYDPATQVQYTIYGYHSSFQGGNVDAVIAIAESLFTPAPPATSATTFRYDTYDTTGAVSTAGSYAFLSDPEDTSTAVTTYEALRDGTTTALLIHTSDADGASRAECLRRGGGRRPLRVASGRRMLRSLHGHRGQARPHRNRPPQAARRRVDDLRLLGLQRRCLDGCCAQHGVGRDG